MAKSRKHIPDRSSLPSSSSQPQAADHYPDWDELRNAPHQEILSGLRKFSAFKSAVETAFLQMVGVCESTGAYRAENCDSTEAFLMGALGYSYRTSFDAVRIAKSLGELPEIRREAVEGHLCWDQLKALLALASPDNDAEMAQFATDKSAREIEAVARRERRFSREEAAEIDSSAYLRWMKIKDGNFLKIDGLLPAADGEVFTKAIERLVDSLPVAGTNQDKMYSGRCAEAMVELASQRLAEDSDPDRALMVIHVDADALMGEGGSANLEDGTPLPIDVAQRLACDCSFEVMVTDSNGNPLKVGRKRRSVSPKSKRALKARDGSTCAWPGCTRKRCQTHHMKHWADGGTTDLDNLMLLCRFHHKFVHEHGYLVIPLPDGRFEFRRPWGEPVMQRPPNRLTRDLRAKLLQWLGPLGPSPLPAAAPG